MSFYGAIEQLLSGWIFEVIPASDADFDQAKELVVDDDLRRPRAAIGKVAKRVWTTRSSNDWSGAGCSPPAAPSPASLAARAAAIALAPPLRRGPAGVGD